MASSPEARVSTLPLLSEAEREEIIAHWNATAEPLPEVTLPDLFAQQALRTPEAVAVSCGDCELSYGALDAWSNRLARRLIGLGVGPERVVGLALDRSVELVVGILAVLKAGGCYLPLDVSHPPARLALMLRDSGASLVLTTEGMRGALPADVPSLAVDAAPEQSPAPIGDDERHAHLRPDHLAYIIYTSGSTGMPKGVAISHRAIVNQTLWFICRDWLGAGDRVLQKTTPGFDASVAEFLSPLSGACLVLAPARATAAGRGAGDDCGGGDHGWCSWCRRCWRRCSDQPALGEARALRLVFCGGEALPAESGGAAFRARAGRDAARLYGPTEATIDATSWPCAASEPSAPLGRPVWNTRVYVLDDRLEPVPPGVIGELYLGGVGLARGYVGRRRPDGGAVRRRSLRRRRAAVSTGRAIWRAGGATACWSSRAVRTAR